MKGDSVAEKCPVCGSASSVRPKFVLIDEAWIPGPGKDPRLAFVADLRVDDVKPEHVRASPLQQFIDGYWCESCGRSFVSETILNESRRHY
jgi:hypothetical protein